MSTSDILRAPHRDVPSKSASCNQSPSNHPKCHTQQRKTIQDDTGPEAPKTMP